MFAQNRDSLLTNNYLTPVRWMLALMVMIGHAWFTSTGFEPLRIHDWSASYMAVNGFFILSGLLIAKSLNSGSSRLRFTLSRYVRILPGLAFLLLAYILYFGPLFTAGYGDTTHDLDLIGYALQVFALQDPEATPGTIFANNEVHAFNGALWTIRFEIIAYFVAALLVWFRLIKGPVSACLSFVAFTTAYFLALYFFENSGARAGLRLMSAFSLGIMLWYVPTLRRIDWLYTGFLVMVFLAFGWTSAGEILANLALAAIILQFGLPRVANPVVNKLPDFSYGIYLWHYPLMQAILVAYPDISPLALFGLALPPTLLISAISWYCIERPSLRLKNLRIPEIMPAQRSASEAEAK